MCFFLLSCHPLSLTVIASVSAAISGWGYPLTLSSRGIVYPEQRRRMAIWRRGKAFLSSRGILYPEFIEGLAITDYCSELGMTRYCDHSKNVIFAGGFGLISNDMLASLKRSLNASSLYSPKLTNRFMRALTSILAQRIQGVCVQ